MRVEKFSGNRRDWNQFAERNGGAITQSYEWGEMRTELGWRPERWVVQNGSEIQAAGLVLKKPLPGGFHMLYMPEGPVVKGDDWNDAKNKQALTTLFAYLKEHATADKAILLKVDPHIASKDFPLDWLQQQGFRDSPEDVQAAYVAHVNLAPDEEQVMANMKQKGRYNIRYAKRKEVDVQIGTSEEDLKIWYGLTKASAQRQGITYRSLDYFKTFQKHFMEESDHAVFIIARHQGKPAAATLVTFFGKRADYLYGGSSDVDRNVFASYLVQWVGMQESKRRGCTVYNMTGVAHEDDPSNPWYGLRQFKLKFGAEVVELIGAWDYVYRPKTYTLFTTADRARRVIAKKLGKVRTQ